MEDTLAIINRIIEWHQTIRRHVKLVGDSVTDQEALDVLDEARADLIPGRPGVLSKKQEKLQQAMNLLDEGLKSHFAYEEKVLPPLLGELLAQALVIEHRGIKNEINIARTAVGSTMPEGMSREESLAEESHTQLVIDNVCQIIEEHAVREESVLGMMRKALEEANRTGTGKDE